MISERASLDEGIRATIDDAIHTGDLLHIPEASRRIVADHPHSGLDAADVAELLLRAGVSARVPLEWASPQTGTREVARHG